MNKVKILLSTYNGEKYLRKQIDSLLSQSYGDVEIIVRDDGSSDGTVKIVESYDIKLLDDKNNLGAKGSFEALMKYTLENTQSEYLMFCDQDDIWDLDKIERSVNRINEMEKEFGDIPLLVHSDLSVIDKNQRVICGSFWEFENIIPSHNSLERLVMQNTITGCTMLVNRKLALLCLPMQSGAVMHDWWLGLVASCFGKIGILDEDTIKYRQHENNEIGATGFNFASVVHKMFYSKNVLGKNMLQAGEFLESYREVLSLKNRDLLENFVALENQGFFVKRYNLIKFGFFKHGVIRNIGLFVKL